MGVELQRHSEMMPLIAADSLIRVAVSVMEGAA